MSYCPDCAANGIITKLDAASFCTTCQEEMILGSPLDQLATALLPIVEAFGEGRIEFQPRGEHDPDNGWIDFGGYKFLVVPRKEVTP